MVDARIDTDMVPEFASDAAQNPLDYMHKASDSGTTEEIPAKQIQVTAQPAVLPKMVSGPTYTEPMDCVPEITQADSPMESAATPPTPMLEDSESKAESPTTMMVENPVEGPKLGPLTAKDLLVLCQMFYLPSEHGHFGLDLLNEFYWLKRHGTFMLPRGSIGSGTKEDLEEWRERAAKFDASVKSAIGLFEKLCACQNRELVYDLYTYVWDMCSILLLLNGFVQWLNHGVCTPKLASYVVGQQTWFSGIREAFLSGDHEPWVFRGGLISDLLRLLPLDSAHDLYTFKYPEVPLNLLYNVRPYLPKDEAQVYALVANLYEEEIEAPMGLCESDRIVVGDKRVGAHLTLCPEYCFVAENMVDGSISAVALMSPDAVQFFTRHNVAWLPEMRIKYPRKVQDEAMLSPIEEMMLSFHMEDEVNELPSCLSSNSDHVSPSGSNSSSGGGALLAWGQIKLFAASNAINDQSVTKRLTMLAMACLRASGTIRVFAEVKSRDVKSKDLYTTLGFHQVAPLVPPNEPSEAEPSNTATAATEAKYSYLTRSF